MLFVAITRISSIKATELLLERSLNLTKQKVVLASLALLLILYRNQVKLFPDHLLKSGKVDVSCF